MKKIVLLQYVCAGLSLAFICYLTIGAVGYLMSKKGIFSL